MLKRMPSISATVTFALAGVVTLALGVYTLVSLSMEKNREWDELKVDVGRTADQLAAGLVLPLWNFDDDQIEKLARSVMEEPAFVGIHISENERERTHIHAFARDAQGRIAPVDSLYRDTDLLYETRVIISSSDTVGKFTIAVTPAFITRDIQARQLFLIVFILILDIILIIALQLVLWKFLLRPLRYLDDYAGAIMSGRQDIRDLQGIRFHGEMDRVRHSLGAMMLQLDERYAELLVSRSHISKEKDRLRVTLNSIGDAVISVDSNGNVVLMNPVAEKLTGFLQAEALGRPVAEIVNIRNDEDDGSIDNSALSVLGGAHTGHSDHHRLTARDGTERLVADAMSPILDDSGAVSGVVLVITDISETIRLEDELRQSQKMDAVGQLAGGIAHDFNNMLGGIVGAADLLSMSIPANDPSGKYVQLILRASEKAADLTRQLLSFSHKAKVQSSPVDLHRILGDAISLLSRSIDKKITIQARFCSDDAWICGDPALLENAFINLGLNARDAMPEGGTLLYTTRILPGNPGDASEMRDPDGCDWIEVTVSDTGLGIPEEIRERIFEPFFTTKGVGKGTGLGLAAVYGTVKEHNGLIALDSTIGQGTVFTLRFPSTEKAASTQGVSTVSRTFAPGKTVLLAEDDAVLKLVAGSILAEFGMTVLSASNGREALDLYAAEADKVDLVILDLVMPVMGGREAFAAMKEINPAIKVLFSSGFSPDSSVAHSIDDPCCVGYLQKPFRRSTLLSLLNSIFRKSDGHTPDEDHGA